MLRGHKVMLDSTLAALYGVETRRLNEQVRRNRARFPVDFLFELTASEFAHLKSQSATSSWGGRRKPQVVTLFAVQSAASPVIKSLLISRVDELRQARTERIALSIRSASAIPQWVGLATMATLTQLIIALAHAGKPGAMRSRRSKPQIQLSSAIVTHRYHFPSSAKMGNPSAIRSIFA